MTDAPARPAVADLVRWLAECPADFLRPPRVRIGTHDAVGEVVVEAVISDVLRGAGAAGLSDDDAVTLHSGLFSHLRHPLDVAEDGLVGSPTNRLSGALIGAWLLSHPAFVGLVDADSALTFLSMTMAELMKIVLARRCVTDDDRREEMARLCLRDLSVIPAGETREQAQDRLSSLSSVERQRVLREMVAAEKRAAAVRAAMKAQQAREAASQYSGV